MWWKELEQIKAIFSTKNWFLSKKYMVETTCKINNGLDSNVLIDETEGKVIIGTGTKICSGAIIKGPIIIGKNCMIGNGALIRGATVIGDNVRVGFASEIKASIIENNVTIGPQCFIGDSKLECNVYLGAQVRTSNHRLDKENIKVFIAHHKYETGKEKLGCLIGKNSSLGIQVVILPGRIIEKNTTVGPKILIEKNLPSGKYILKQQILFYPEV